MSSSTNNTGHKVAIIGGGFSGVAVVTALLRASKQSNVSGLEITLFEPRPIGPGQVYPLDGPDSFLINQELGFMGSINLSLEQTDRYDFYKWAQTHVKALEKIYPEYSVDDPNGFVPRSMFGRYVQDRYHDAKAFAAMISVQIHEEHKKVTDIMQKGTGFEVTTEAGTDCFDIVVLATGVYFRQIDKVLLASGKAFSMLEHEKYLADDIRDNSIMLISGSGLSAYDAAISALESGKYSKVILSSRRGLLRKVRGQYQPYERKHLTADNLAKLTTDEQHLSLEQLIGVIKAELSEAYGRPIDWKQSYTASELSAILRHDISTVENGTELMWRSVLNSTSDADKTAFYNMLSETDKADFLQHYQSLYQSFTAPMPIDNATKIATYIEQGSIEFVNGADHVSYLPEEQKFVLTYRENEQGAPLALDDTTHGVASLSEYPVKADVYVDATGPSRSIAHVPLYSQLLRTGLVSEQANGGIRVDLDTRNVIDREGNTIPRLYAIGHMDCGETFLSRTSIRLSDIALSLGPRLIADLQPTAPKDVVTSTVSNKPKSVIYTGTFDPFHVGHFETISAAYEKLAFDKVIVAIIRNNPMKPNASAWQQRATMAKLALKRADFSYDIQAIEYISPQEISQLIQQHDQGSNLIRLVGSDSIIEFINNKSLWPVLTLCHYAIYIRKINSVDEVENAIVSLPKDIRDRFSYEVVGEQEVSREARRIRQDIESSHADHHIHDEVFEHIKASNLYDYRVK